MIIKQTPEDFQVEELTEVQPSEGPFALYRLDKTGWTTADALNAVRRRWKLDHRRLSYGGLKDRHAQTSQHFTVLRGPERRLTHQGFTVTYLGRLPHPFSSEHIQANRFHLVVRAVSAEDQETFLRTFDEVRSFGVPNYFDDQRFGSVTGDAPFLAKAIILGQYEEALRLALAAYYPHDRRPQKKEKALLRSHWGDWPRCKEELPRGHARSLVDYLVTHPQDFKGAIARLRPELRGLYLSAYQSHLWNRMLAGWLRAHLAPDQLALVPLKLGPVPMHGALDETTFAQLRALVLPLHSPRAVFEGDDPRRPFFEQVLREENLTLDQFKLKGLPEMFFSRGERSALCLPGRLEQETEPDEAHPGLTKIRLHFDLPRGSYATLLVKRLTTPE